MGLWPLFEFLLEIPFGTIFGVLLLGGLFALSFCPSIFHLFENRIVRASVYACAAIVCLQYLFWTAGYLMIPTYFDHVEPAVVVSAELLLRGQQIYPSWDNGDGLYGMIYGPILYFIHAGFLLVIKSIFSTKIAGVLAIWGALIFMALEVKQLTRSAPIVLLALGCIVLFFLKFGNSTFWNRPEPFLILFSAVAIQALRFPRYRAAVAIGLFSGVAIGLKIYAILFFAPTILALVVREETFAMGLRIGALASAVAAVVAVAPFLHPSVSLHGYIEYMNITAQHGLSLKLFYDNIIHFALITAPIVLIYFLRRPNWSSEIRWLTLALFACISVVAVIASKHGAGPHHLLPFLPIALYSATRTAAFVHRRTDRRIGSRVAVQCFFILYFLGLSPLGISEAIHLNRRIVDSRHEQSFVDELTKIYAAHPLSEMGVSDAPNYRSTYYRVVGILAETPVHLDVAFLMDLRAVGIGSRETEKFVESCKVREWVLPAKGMPFSISNAYEFEGERELFSDRFRQTFEKNYRIVFKGKYYNVWSCREDSFPERFVS